MTLSTTAGESPEVGLSTTSSHSALTRTSMLSGMYSRSFSFCGSVMFSLPSALKVSFSALV